MAYTEDQGTYGWIRKLLALPFLPYTEITTQFEHLPLGAEGPHKDLAEYIASQWICNAIFPVKDWSLFMQPVQTNNDIEGWHNALKQGWLKCRCVRLVADHKLMRIQWRKYCVLQTKLHDQWEQYQSQKKTARQLLKSCSKPHTVNSKTDPKKIPCIVNKTFRY